MLKKPKLHSASVETRPEAHPCNMTFLTPPADDGAGVRCAHTRRSLWSVIGLIYRALLKFIPHGGERSVPAPISPHFPAMLRTFSVQGSDPSIQSCCSCMRTHPISLSRPPARPLSHPPSRPLHLSPLPRQSAPSTAHIILFCQTHNAPSPPPTPPTSPFPLSLHLPRLDTTCKDTQTLPSKPTHCDTSAERQYPGAVCALDLIFDSSGNAPCLLGASHVRWRITSAMISGPGK